MAVTLLPKKQKSSCEVSNKTYMLWDLYEIMHIGIKAVSFSNLATTGVHFIETPCIVTPKIIKDDLGYVLTLSFPGGGGGGGGRNPPA